MFFTCLCFYHLWIYIYKTCRGLTCYWGQSFIIVEDSSLSQNGCRKSVHMSDPIPSFSSFPALFFSDLNQLRSWHCKAGNLIAPSWAALEHRYCCNAKNGCHSVHHALFCHHISSGEGDFHSLPQIREVPPQWCHSIAWQCLSLCWIWWALSC